MEFPSAGNSSYQSEEFKLESTVLAGFVSAEWGIE